MAKTDFATIWTTLPRPVQDYYGARPNLFSGSVRFESLVATAHGYDRRMGRPLFRNVSVQLFDEAGLGEPEWYKALTLGQWVREMTARVDPTAAWRRRVGRVFASPQGVDYLTDAAFPNLPVGKHVEGYGALGHDTDPAPGGGRNPIFELRSPTKTMTVDEFEP